MRILRTRIANRPESAFRPPPRSQYAGINLSGLAYYGVNFPFADLTKSGGGWGPSSGSFPGVDGDGYPTSLASGQTAGNAVIWDYTQPPTGKFTMLWEGNGNVGFANSRMQVLESSANRIVAVATDRNAACFPTIFSTDPANHVRNVRFLVQGTEFTYLKNPFNPAFLQLLAPFSCLRFMDWGRTNDANGVVEWNQRTLPSSSTYTGGTGVPIEVMIQLANLLHVNPWFCIPHGASDDFVTKLAALVHARLDPTLKPHFEYSNEVWNFGFSQIQYAIAQSDALGLSRPYGLPGPWYGKRVTECLKLIRSVFGADAGRVVGVLGGQSSWTQFLTDALAYGDTAANVDAIAVAPYYGAVFDPDGLKNAGIVATATPDQLVDKYLVTVRGQMTDEMTANAAVASAHGLKMLGYESGPGDSWSWLPTQQQQDACTAATAAAMASPRMAAVMSEFFGIWKAKGGACLNHFNDIGPCTKYGPWGLIDHLTDNPLNFPKYQGLMNFIAANP